MVLVPSRDVSFGHARAPSARRFSPSHWAAAAQSVRREYRFATRSLRERRVSLLERIADGTSDKRLTNTIPFLMTQIVEEYAQRAGIPIPANAPGPVKCGKVLSFSVGHEQSLETIAEFVGAVCKKPEKIILDFQAAEEIYLGAAAVLLALAQDANEGGIRIEVLLPENEELKQRLAVCGLLYILEDAGSIAMPPNAILPLDRMPRDPELSKSALTKQAASQVTRVSDRLQTWLLEHAYELVPEFRDNFLRIIGETLENAVYHSDSGWWVCANLRSRAGSTPLLEVTVFNFGDSIAGSLLTTLSPQSQTYADLEHLRQEHSRRGAFSLQWTEDNLRGLFAIQDGSSRFGLEEQRGRGTRKIVDTFQCISNIANKHPDCRLGWVSGYTAIYLDGRYGLGPSTLPSRAQRKDIAFNGPNDLQEIPDQRSVVNVERFFPGTLLKLEVPLNDEYLVKQKVQHGN